MAGFHQHPYCEKAMHLCKNMEGKCLQRGSAVKCAATPSPRKAEKSSPRVQGLL